MLSGSSARPPGRCPRGSSSRRRPARACRRCARSGRRRGPRTWPPGRDGRPRDDERLGAAALLRPMEGWVVGTIVVVGAGIAGLRTVQQLRLRGCVEQIVVLGGEEHVPYDRPPLSKAVLRGERGLPGLLSDEQLAELGAEWRLGTTAREVDTVARKVLTDSGALDYDTLVLATGAVPRRVPLLPGDVLRTWDDAQRIRASLRPGATVAVIGAGLIGCEVAASATALGAEVHLIDVLPGPMTRVVGPAVAPMIGDIHRQRGVHLHTSTNVAAAEEDSLSLSDGSLLRPDLVLHAIGVVPDTDWLISSGLVLSDG